MFVLGITGAYVIAELAGGLYTHSLALIADAGHLAADALGLAMAVAAIRFAQRPATPSKTYGFYRAEILAAMINGWLLLGIVAFIVFEAIQRLQRPPEVDALTMLVVACGGLVVTLVGAVQLHGGARESLTVKGAYLEVLGDMLGAAGTIAAALVLLTSGWALADPLISLVIALLILPRAWGLLKSVVDVLLEGAPEGINLAEIEGALRSVSGAVAAHDLHIWSITSGFVAMSGHLTVRGRASEDVLHDARKLLKQRFNIEHATLQIEQEGHADDGACCVVDPRCLVVGPSLSIVESTDRLD